MRAAARDAQGRPAPAVGLASTSNAEVPWAKTILFAQEGFRKARHTSVDEWVEFWFANVGEDAAVTRAA
ncbi:MAG: hypothetical protein NVS3B20_26650 [Polyangiales bacterium]